MNLVQRGKAIINFKFGYLYKSFGKSDFKLLDVGAGNKSASRIKAIFENCSYYGVDMNADYNNSAEDFRLMKEFYELDLTKLEYGIIPNLYFDGIWMAHVIEHLHNGDQVLPGLISKLKPGGYFYIEFPGKKSTKLPSMYGTLNFNDDPTHVRLYSWQELKTIFENNGCTVLEAGVRRNWFYIVATPLRIIISLVRNKGKVEGNVFWDFFGFAEFLWVKKN